MFGAKRRPRKIGQDGDDGDEDVKMSHGAEEGDAPTSTFKPSTKAKRKTASRTSFGLGGTSMNDDDGDEGTTTVFTPKKSTLGRQTLEKNALRRSLAAASIQADQLPLRQPNDSRPSYSADALNELKSSTPSTPKDIKSKTDIAPPEPVHDVSTKSLDLAAKFGSDLALTNPHNNPAIPTTAEILEKKVRRARLAKEQDFISLNDDDDDDDDGEDQQQTGGDADDSDEEFKPHHLKLQHYSAPKPPKYEESRLAPHDDEDIAEGFDEFVEDGRVALGRKEEREQRQRQKAEMRTLIRDAEGGSSSDAHNNSSDDSERERRAAYDAAQTRAGMDGLRQNEQGGAKAKRPRTPPRITPLPSLVGVRERLAERVERRQGVLGGLRGRLEEVRGELGDVAVRKKEVQGLLDEAGERFRRLRAEADGVTDGEGGGGVEVDGGGERRGLGMGLASSADT